RRPGPRPRFPRDDFAPARFRPRAPDLPPRRPRFPTHGRVRGSGPRHSALITLKEIATDEHGRNTEKRLPSSVFHRCSSVAAFRGRSQAVSQEEVDTKKADWEVAKATVIQAQAKVKEAQHRQFALTIATTAIISAVNALTLKPAQSATWLRPPSGRRKFFVYRAFNAVYDRVEHWYAASIRWVVRH